MITDNSISGISTSLKARQQKTWATGNYSVVGTTLQIVGETLCEALDLRAGSSVLDVAGGNGCAALAAARRWCDVTCSDYVPSLLADARKRAEAEALPMRFEIADAEALPYESASFDVVVSTFGVMFTPQQELAATELARVCRPGGRIGLANWTPDGFIGQVFKLIGEFLPPPAGIPSPSLWGTRERLDELFDPTAWEVRAQRRHFMFRYHSPEHWISVFRDFYGPICKTYEALGEVQQVEFTRRLILLLKGHNAAADGTLVLPSAYLEVVILNR